MYLHFTCMHEVYKLMVLIFFIAFFSSAQYVSSLACYWLVDWFGSELFMFSRAVILGLQRYCSSGAVSCQKTPEKGGNLTKAWWKSCDFFPWNGAGSFFWSSGTLYWGQKVQKVWKTTNRRSWKEKTRSHPRWNQQATQ